MAADFQDAARIEMTAHDSHSLLVRMVGGGKRVLDVGCGTGDTSAELARFNPRVIGIEPDRDAAERAKKLLDDVVVADVAEVDFAETFGRDAFDVVVFEDVLESLADPVAVLRGAMASLAPSGFVVASIPNVAHASVRIDLLRGRFERRSDREPGASPIHFFTRGSVVETFSEAGLAISISNGSWSTQVMHSTRRSCRRGCSQTCGTTSRR